MTTKVDSGTNAAIETLVGQLCDEVRGRYADAIWREWFDHQNIASPIERLFIAAFTALHLSWMNQSQHGGDAKLIVLLPGSCGSDAVTAAAREVENRSSTNHIDIIVPQCKIGRYHADFCIQRVVDCSRHVSSDARATKPIVVECDGHEFHERTKEQASRDKARDRFIQSEGFQVYRFTGSELWRDPMGCVKQIDDVLDSRLSHQWRGGSK